MKTMKGTLMLLLLFLAAGCAAPRPAPPSGDVNVEIRPTPFVTVSQVRVERKDGGLRVRGGLRRTAWALRFPGHVDVRLVAPDGTTLAEKHVPVPGLNSRRRGVEDVPFTASVEGPVPAGATVIVFYHPPGP